LALICARPEAAANKLRGSRPSDDGNRPTPDQPYNITAFIRNGNLAVENQWPAGRGEFSERGAKQRQTRISLRAGARSTLGADDGEIGISRRIASSAAALPKPVQLNAAPCCPHQLCRVGLKRCRHVLHHTIRLTLAARAWPRGISGAFAKGAWLGAIFNWPNGRAASVQARGTPPEVRISLAPVSRENSVRLPGIVT
jgi:hypothetical protein